MRIAQIAPLYEAVPPKLYGGTERVVAHLCNALVRRGHHVVLFASGDSRTDARLAPARDVAIRLDRRISADWPAHLAMLLEVRDRAFEFDILHFHIDGTHLPIFADMAERTLTTLHGRLDCDDLKRLFARFVHFPVVSISNSQRAPMPGLRWMATIHHGYPIGQYRFAPEPLGGYLAFLGRISPEKGIESAIAIARGAGLPLRIAGKVDAVDRAYFTTRIQHLLDAPDIDFVGEIGEEAKSAFLGGAVALLAPIAWPEPFGLVMIEAMACGTPVIAFRRGSVPEVVDHGVSGFVVDTVDEAVAAVRQAQSLDRARVRRTFEARFTADVMTEKYETVYRALLSPRLGPRPVPETVHPLRAMRRWPAERPDPGRGAS